MAIRKILNGKLVEMGPIPTGDKKDVCKTCALGNEKSQCMTPDDTCMGYPDENWHLVEDLPRMTLDGVVYMAAPNVSQQACLGCVTIPFTGLCKALSELRICDNRYWIKSESENTQENNQ